MRISISELLQKHLVNHAIDSDDPVARTIQAVGLGPGGDQGDCWVEVEHEDGEAFSKDLANAAYENGVPKENKVKVLACAAICGHVQSMIDLGWRFHIGNDVARDLMLAIYWHALAANRGNADAMHHLGNIFTEKGSPVWDGPKGIFWFEKAVSEGDWFAKGDLAHCLLCGKCVAKDEARAESLLVDAIRVNHDCEDWQKDLARCPLKPGEVRNRFGQKMRQIDVDFYHACRTASVKKLKEMLERGANPNAAWYNDIGDDFYPVHKAALNPDFDVLKFVIASGADPCQNDFWSAQPLAYAVRQGSLEKVRYLIGLGNDPSRVDCDGSSVFFQAAANPDVRVLELLLEHDVDMNAGADDMTPMSRALVDSTPERVKWLADHGAWMCDAVERRAYRTPLANLRAILECGYDPNTFDEDSNDTKVIDHLDPRRQALFEEFGGTVLNRNAEKFCLTYKGEIHRYRRYGVVEFKGKRYSLCEDIWSDNAPTLSSRGMALGVRHDETMDEDGFYPCATLYFTGSDGVHPVEVTEGPSETMWFNPVLCQFKDISDGIVLEL